MQYKIMGIEVGAPYRFLTRTREMLKISSFGKSDIGLRRSNNEDAFLVNMELGINVLADGMGGPAAGEIASDIFTKTALEIFMKNRVETEPECRDIIQDAYRIANKRILDHAEAHPKHKGMGCTAELLFFFDHIFLIGHVGDSRTYLYRNGQLKQLTKDHSLVQQQLDQGLISHDQVRTHKYRNVLLRAVGTSEVLAVDILKGKVAPGDLFLLCSDGLSALVEDDAIGNALASGADIDETAETLIQMAKTAGGHDNITVILSKVLQ